MSLDHAILGFLNYNSSSGYDLKRAFDLSVQHFWPADQSQIYRTLNRLTKRGWTEQEVVMQEDRPNRKVYHITEAGRAELREWLTRPLPVQDERHATLIQVFFAGQLSDEEILVMFERVAEQYRTILAMYDQVPHQMEPYITQVNSERECFFWLLTLDLGKRKTQAFLDWVESVIEKIQQRHIPSGGYNGE